MNIRNDNLVRFLGASETYFWLSDQSSCKHFVLAAQISGATTVTQWRTALAAAQRRHPLLNTYVEADSNGTPRFRHLPENAIPLRVVESASATHWEREMETELSIRLPLGRSLPVRAVLVQGLDQTTLLLAVHHSIADGLSIAYLLRDLLQAMAGRPLATLPVPPAQEMLFQPLNSLQTAAAAPDTPSAPARPGRRLDRRGGMPQVRSMLVDGATGTKLREKARHEGATVHGALVAALTLAGRRIHATWGQSPVRVVSPVNNRPLLGRDDDCALSIIFPMGLYEPQSSAEFWPTARLVCADLAGPRTPQGLAATLNAFGQLISAKPGVHGIEQFELEACACEMMVSNLGVLPFDAQIGELRLDAVWGPSVLIGLEGEQMIGVSTIGNTIHLLHTSYNPIPGLLDAMHVELLSAIH